MLWCRLLKSPRRANTMFPKQSNLNWQFIGHLSSEGKAFREVMRRERRRAEEKKHLSVVIPPLVFVLFWFARFQTFWSQPTTKWLLRDCRFILTPPTLPRKVQNFHRVIKELTVSHEFETLPLIWIGHIETILKTFLRDWLSRQYTVANLFLQSFWPEPPWRR